MKNNSLLNNFFETAYQNRQRIEIGLVNSIPWPFTGLNNLGYGINKGRYIIVTANSKVGKSQLADFLFIINIFILKYIMNLPIDVKINYFTLEVSVKEKIAQFQSFLLYHLSNGNIRQTKEQLLSNQSIQDKSNLDLLYSNYEFSEKLLSFVDFREDLRTPSQILGFLNREALSRGIYTYEDKIVAGNLEKVRVGYKAKNPEEYWISIIDHVGLLSGSDLFESIGALSKGLVELRNNYDLTPVIIQQQMSAQESVEHAKFGRLKPTADGLADNKTTQRDCNMIIGLFNPQRFDINYYPDTKEGYQIKPFRDHIRFLEVIFSRDGGAGRLVPLFFDGAVNYFEQLPLPNETDKLKNVIEKIRTLST